jgi:hypothetical protein
VHYRYRETVYHITVSQTSAANDGMNVTVDGLESEDKIAASVGRPVAEDRFILLDQSLLTGRPLVRRTEFKHEAGGLTLQDRRMRSLQVREQRGFDVVARSNENPLSSVRQTVNSGRRRCILLHRNE